jgi:thymidylate kinase
VGNAAGLIYVAGISGAGKSTVCVELRRRGYDAHDSDLENNAVWVDRNTGEAIGRIEGASRTPGFLERYEWRFDPERVAALARRAEDHPVFLCGATANEAEVWPLFRCTIYLAIDDETLRHRLATRTSNDFGRSEHEREMVLSWHHVADDDYRRFGAVVIDGTRALTEVVDEVLSVAIGPRR